MASDFYPTYRGGRVTDVIIDTAGVILATGLIALVAGRNQRKSFTSLK